MDVIGHDAVGEQAITNLVEIVDFLCHDTGSAFIFQPARAMGAAVKPGVIAAKVFFMQAIEFILLFRPGRFLADDLFLLEPFFEHLFERGAGDGVCQPKGDEVMGIHGLDGRRPVLP